MIVKTHWRFRSPPEVLWPLLCDSKMLPESSLLFRLGLPRPTHCELPAGEGGIGSARRCVSDRGVIEQTILHWEAPRHLAFRMDRTGLWFRGWVEALADDFVLEPLPDGGARVTRMTHAEVRGGWGWAKRAMLRVGLKKIHRFVFRNWARLSEARAV